MRPALHAAAQHSTPPHSNLLSSYAAHMKSLSAALDTRAHALRNAEARLESRGSALRAHERALASLERRMRSEMTAFLRDVAARQRQLSRWEQRAEKGRKLVAAITNNKEQLKTTKTALEHKNTQLQLVEKEYAALTQSRDAITSQIDAAKTELGRLATEARRISDEKIRLETLANRLEMLEAAVRKREREVDATEAAVAVKSERLASLENFERVVAPLQAFVDDFSALEQRETVSIRDDVAGGVQIALMALREMHTKLRAFTDTRAQLDGLQANLERRENSLRERELSIRQREHTVDVTETRISTEQDKLSLQNNQLKEGMRSLDTTRADIDRREEQIHKKERELMQRESKLQHREAAITQSEKTLARRERSIRRAHSAVTEREAAIDQRERDVETERANFNNMKRSIDLREAMLETRELELVAREASLSDNSRPLLSEHSRTKRQADGSGHEAHSGVQEREGLIGKEVTKEQSVSEEGGKYEPGNVSPPRKQPRLRTVRRQLEFETAHRRLPNVGQGDTRQADGDDEDNDNGSEAAAEQLLPELVSARALWKERILRLQVVVRNMRDNTWGLKAHVQPVLNAVADKLGSVRSEIETAPLQHSAGSAKQDYAAEQGLQVRWGSIMREQLDAVREVQTGMLIGLNKQEEAAQVGEMSDESSTVTTGEKDSGLRSAGSLDQESSVDATLDVTTTLELKDEIRGQKQEARAIPSLFQGVGSRRQARGRQGDNLALQARDEGLGRRTRRRIATSGGRLGEPSVNRAGDGTTDLFQELASLRSELDTITGILNKINCSRLLLDGSRLKPLAARVGNGNKGRKCVKWLLSILVIVSLSGETNSDTIGDVADTRPPDLLVELRINADISGSHSPRRKFADHLDRTRGLPLETIPVQSLVKVDGVIASDHLGSARLPVFRLCLLMNVCG
ncbi:hypothetical protein FGB62_98g036 [Gracilaria domingensis]|nr:hypothetical protein FGB62_98g036 [Gracilaria domingensis]